ncbi:3443_t:CDS:1, partial [Paraglomus brasilianum]
MTFCRPHPNRISRGSASERESELERVNQELELEQINQELQEILQSE